MSADPLRDLRRLFAWRDDGHHAAQLASLERGHLTAVASTLNTRLDAGVRDALEALPDEAYLAIMRGADTCFAALYGPPGELDGSVARWITVERAELGAPATPDGTLRAAGCHRRVQIASGRVVAIDDAPCVPGTRIALDFTSELPSRLVTRFPERILAVPTPEERALTTCKLAGAVALLDAASPLAGDFVRRMTDVICCRTAPGDGRFFTASDQATLGVTHLINTHLARKTPSEVASELVHEAIHQAVFRHELVAPLLPDRAITLEQVTSPWTGAVLDLHAYLHACFVWYGVANLWRLSAAAALPPPGRQREVAEAGFARQPLAHLGPLGDRLPAALRATIADMTDEICAEAA
jgi:HEXXH motif-containing protein